MNNVKLVCKMTIIFHVNLGELLFQQWKIDYSMDQYPFCISTEGLIHIGRPFSFLLPPSESMNITGLSRITNSRMFMNVHQVVERSVKAYGGHKVSKFMTMVRFEQGSRGQKDNILATSGENCQLSDHENLHKIENP